MCQLNPKTNTNTQNFAANKKPHVTATSPTLIKIIVYWYLVYNVLQDLITLSATLLCTTVCITSLLIRNAFRRSITFHVILKRYETKGVAAAFTLMWLLLCWVLYRDYRDQKRSLIKPTRGFTTTARWN